MDAGQARKERDGKMVQEDRGLRSLVGNPRTPEQEEEIAKSFAAYRARQEEMWRAERGDTKLQISLIAADDDAATFSREYQAELHTFVNQVRADGLEIETFGMAMDAADGQGGTIGEFLIALAVIGPALGRALAAWLKGRAGRHVQLKFGDTNVKGRTPAEIEELLKLVAKYRDEKPKAAKGKK